MGDVSDGKTISVILGVRRFLRNRPKSLAIADTELAKFPPEDVRAAAYDDAMSYGMMKFREAFAYSYAGTGLPPIDPPDPFDLSARSAVPNGDCCDTPAYCSSVRRCTAQDEARASPQPADKRAVPDMSKSWPERDYMCVCAHCGETFIGWKRQAVCRGCASPEPAPSEPADVEALAQAVLDARSHIGPCRPDDREDAAQWDALTEAARRLAGKGE